MNHVWWFIHKTLAFKRFRQKGAINSRLAWAAEILSQKYKDAETTKPIIMLSSWTPIGNSSLFGNVCSLSPLWAALRELGDNSLEAINL